MEQFEAPILMIAKNVWSNDFFGWMERRLASIQSLKSKRCLRLLKQRNGGRDSGYTRDVSRLSNLSVPAAPPRLRGSGR